MKNVLRILFIFLFLSNSSFSQTSKLDISIDERIETLYTIAYLDNYFLATKHNSHYTKFIDKNLQSLKYHRAVVLFDSLSRNYGFNYYRPVEWILQFSELPELYQIKQKVDSLDLTVVIDKKYLLDSFRIELINFYQDSLFQNYLKEMQPINLEIIQKVKESGTIDKLPDYLKEYFGDSLSTYNLILSPLMHSGGFNAELVNKQSEIEVYALIGPIGEIEFYPYFDREYLEMDMVLHEFSHSFVNPLMYLYEPKIQKLKSKFYDSILQENGKAEGYDEWINVFNELVIRAIVINITREKFGQKKANELLDYEKSIGFNLVETISDILKSYEKNREKYKTFEQFYPVLIESL